MVGASLCVSSSLNKFEILDSHQIPVGIDVSSAPSVPGSQAKIYLTGRVARQGSTRIHPF